MAGVTVFAGDARHRDEPRGPVVTAYVTAGFLHELGFACALAVTLIVARSHSVVDGALLGASVHVSFWPVAMSTWSRACRGSFRRVRGSRLTR
jgi:hypothetical protein